MQHSQVIGVLGHIFGRQTCIEFILVHIVMTMLNDKEAKYMHINLVILCISHLLLQLT